MALSVIPSVVRSLHGLSERLALPAGLVVEKMLDGYVPDAVIDNSFHGLDFQHPEDTRIQIELAGTRQLLDGRRRDRFFNTRDGHRVIGEHAHSAVLIARPIAPRQDQDSIARDGQLGRRAADLLQVLEHHCVEQADLSARSAAVRSVGAGSGFDEAERGALIEVSPFLPRAGRKLAIPGLEELPRELEQLKRNPACRAVPSPSGRGTWRPAYRAIPGIL